MKKIYTLFSTLLLSAPLFGANISVSNTNDSGIGSLRDAIANITTGDTVFFEPSLANATIVVTSPLSVSSSFVIQGFSTGGTVELSGNASTRILSLISGYSLTINYVDFRDGYASTGAAILNSGTIELNNCRLFNNISSPNSSSSQGGSALYNNTGAIGTINYCEFYGNSADTPTTFARGGAIFNRGSALNINFSSFYNNTASANLVSQGGAIYSSSPLNIYSSTFSLNNCFANTGEAYGGSIYISQTNAVINNSTIVQGQTNGPLSFGGNIYNFGSTLQIENTVISNGAAFQGNDIYSNSASTTTSLGYNLIKDTLFSSVSMTTGDIILTDPLLVALSYNNSGFTKTHSLMNCSPLINTGNNLNAPTFDQANQSRIFGATIDIGAYEAQTILTTAPTITPSAQNPVICPGDTTAITALLGGGASGTYTWDNSLGSGQSQDVNPSTTTTYIVTGTESISGCSSMASVQVMVQPTFLVGASSPDTMICNGESTLLQASASVPVTIMWNQGLGAALNQTVSPTTTTSYVVTGIAISTGCSVSDTITITITPPPSITVSAQNPTICEGDTTTITASLGGGGTGTYSWDNGITGQSQDVSPINNYSYTVTATETSTGCINTATVSITVNPLPTVTANSTSTTICLGDSVTLTGGGASTYSWDNGITDGIATAPTATTTYEVTGTASGCSNTASISVLVNPIPTTPVVTLTGISLTTGTYANYQWYLNGNLIASETSQTYTPTANGNYTIEVTDGNGCSNSSAIFNMTTVGIGELIGFDLNIYPNPTENILNFENIEFTSITIFNNVGQKIKVSSLNKGYNQVNVTELPKGFYILQFATDNTATYSSSFIKK